VTTRIRISTIALTCALGCGADDDDDDGGAGGAASSASSGVGVGVGGTGGAGGSTGGTGGAAPSCLRDPCEAHPDRQTCCADAACGWHQGTGHQLVGIAPCVAKERVCEAGGEKVRDCPAGTTCIVEGAAQETENDCTLPPPMQVYLPGRGICGCR
jgi:hypothetical protein